jgi:hypothetical protein
MEAPPSSAYHHRYHCPFLAVAIRVADVSVRLLADVVVRKLHLAP